MRDDLQELLFAYMEAGGITHAPKKAHVLCKTGTKQEIQVIKCELLPRFQGTCMQKHCQNIKPEQGVSGPDNARIRPCYCLIFS